MPWRHGDDKAKGQGGSNCLKALEMETDRLDKFLRAGVLRGGVPPKAINYYFGASHESTET
jgi:hypothetical protein